MARWEFSLHRWPVAGRAFRRAAMTPRLLGAIVCAATLTVTAGSVYVAAVPSLAAVSPFAQQFLAQDAGRIDYPGDLPLTGAGLEGEQAPDSGEVSSGESPEFAPADILAAGGTVQPADAASAGSTDGLAVLAAGGGSTINPPGVGNLPASSSTSGVSGAASGSAAPASSSGGNIGGSASSGSSGSSGGSSSSGSSASTPSSSSSGAGGASGSSSDSGSSGNSGSNANSGSGGNSGSSSSDAPSAATGDSTINGLDEATEARIAQALRDCFDILDGHAAHVYALLDDYSRLCMSTDQQARIASAQEVDKLLYTVQVAESDSYTATGDACGISSGGIYAVSRYCPNYESLHNAYGRLITCLYELSHAWSGNTFYADPSANVDYWASRLPMASDGVPVSMHDYESYRKGGRP